LSGEINYLWSFCIDEEVANMVLLLKVDLHSVRIPNLVRDHRNVDVVQPQAGLGIFGLQKKKNNKSVYIMPLYGSFTRC